MQQAVSAMVAISQKAIMTQQPLFEEEPFAKSKMLNVVLLYTLLYIALLDEISPCLFFHNQGLWLF